MNGAMEFTDLWIGQEPYTREARDWLDRIGKHYLQNAPPGCMFAVGVRKSCPDLFGGKMPAGPRLGICTVGRPVAPRLPQDGTVAEITRMVLLPGLPHGTASAVLRHAAERCASRGVERLIAYHDRTRHTGCIYRKAGFRKDGTSTPTGSGWGSRPGRKSARYEATPKRRWLLEIQKGVI